MWNQEFKTSFSFTVDSSFPFLHLHTHTHTLEKRQNTVLQKVGIVYFRQESRTEKYKFQG